MKESKAFWFWLGFIVAISIVALVIAMTQHG